MTRDFWTSPNTTKLDIDHAYHKTVRQPNGSYLNTQGTSTWYNELGQHHRIDGPSIIYTRNGPKRWYLNGKLYDFNEWLTLTPIPDEQKLLLRLQYE
jgi:hypothetical protein